MKVDRKIYGCENPAPPVTDGRIVTVWNDMVDPSSSEYRVEAPATKQCALSKLTIHRAGVGTGIHYSCYDGKCQHHWTKSQESKSNTP